MNKKVKIIIARLGMDAHWRGSIVVARALRDAGCEVVYLGNQMPEAIVRATEDEDAEVLGLSSLSGNHVVLVPQVIEMLREQGMERVTVVLGGSVPARDVPMLQAMGVAKVFGPGSSLKGIVDFVQRQGERNWPAGRLSPKNDQAHRKNGSVDHKTAP